MLDMDMINSTIIELENAETSFLNCDRLASLYIIRNEFTKEPKEEKKADNTKIIDLPRKELNDILPQYTMYKEIKKKFQMRDATKEQVIYAMNILCKEITEFIQTLYSSTDMEEERTLIKRTIEDLKAL